MNAGTDTGDGAETRLARPERGDELELTIDRLAHGGEGVARYGDGGYVVFVSGAIPGDRVRAIVVKRKRSYAHARAIEIIEPSPERIPPTAPHPGVAWQVLPYERQLQIKAEQVDDALRRIGKLDGFELEEIVPALEQWRYRNKLEYSFGESTAESSAVDVSGGQGSEGDGGTLVCGFHAPGGWKRVEPIEDCLLASEVGNRARSVALRWAREQGLSAWARAGRPVGGRRVEGARGGRDVKNLDSNDMSGTDGSLGVSGDGDIYGEHPIDVSGGDRSLGASGEHHTPPRRVSHAERIAPAPDGRPYLRNLVVREGRRTGRLQVRLVTTDGELDVPSLAAALVAELGEQVLSGVLWTRSSALAETTMGGETELVWGEAELPERLHIGTPGHHTDSGLDLRISPEAFFQTNTEMAEVLYGVARDYAALEGWERVYDLYCGTGTIALALAPRAGELWGIEIVESAVADAIAAAKRNEISNARFFAGDARLALPELIERAGRPDVVIVDPPRAGLSQKVVRRIIDSSPKRIVYVSCNPTTLAPNAAQLVEAGYRLVKVRPVDMFPQTPHVECVALLERA